MPWYRIEIPESESAIALMNAFEGLYIAELSSGEPTDVSVHHHETEEGGHVYLFSPGASKLAPELLRQFNATACATDPELNDFVEIRI